MSDTRAKGNYTANDPYDAPVRQRSSVWTGFVVFGGIMLVMTGGFQAIQGFVALFEDDRYLVTKNGLLLTMDYTSWGWTHLILGLAAIGVGVGVLLGQMWARVLGIIVAVLSALTNIAFLPAYPIWCAIVITTNILVIYALAVHGSEIKDA